jgi:hypothetical protein
MDLFGISKPLCILMPLNLLVGLIGEWDGTGFGKSNRKTILALTGPGLSRKLTLYCDSWISQATWAMGCHVDMATYDRYRSGGKRGRI